MFEEKFRPFVVTAITGCLLWTLTGGGVHAFLICPDYKAMDNDAIKNLFQIQPIISLALMGLFYGFLIESAKFMGAWFRSELLVLILPLVAGAVIGYFQANIVVEDFWGFGATTIFKADGIRGWTGVIFGIVLSYPVITLGIKIRQYGKPW